jgi:hypothetical protein
MLKWIDHLQTTTTTTASTTADSSLNPSFHTYNFLLDAVVARFPGRDSANSQQQSLSSSTTPVTNNNNIKEQRAFFAESMLQRILSSLDDDCVHNNTLERFMVEYNLLARSSIRILTVAVHTAPSIYLWVDC